METLGLGMFIPFNEGSQTNIRNTLILLLNKSSTLMPKIEVSVDIIGGFNYSALWYRRSKIIQYESRNSY